MGLVEAYNDRYVWQSKVITNRLDIVNVLVEDDVDVRFWNALLNPNSKGINFKIKSYRKSEDGTINIVRGKDHILQNHTFGKSLIACVDSDYDYLFPSISINAKIISNNPYLLQTYTYAIENYISNPLTLPQFCVDLTAEQTDFDFVSFFEKLSTIVYPLLLWSLVTENIGKIHTKKIMPRSEFETLLNSNKYVFSEKTATQLLDELQSKIDTKISTLERTYPEFLYYVQLQDKLIKYKGVKRNNAYLFIHGHSLIKIVVNNLLCPIIKNLRSRHLQVLAEKRTDSECVKRDKENRRKQYENTFNYNNMKVIDYIKREIEKNKEFKQFPHLMYRKMCFSIDKLLNQL